VIDKEQREFLSKITEQTLNIADPSEFLREYAVKRLLFFHSLLNLGRLRSESFHNLKPDISLMILNFREKEKEIIIRILDKGTGSGIFSKVDTAGTANLYLDLLRGLRISIVDKKNEFYLEQEEFDKLMRKTNDFTEIFIKGLRSS
jgi:hypothetical protein